MDIHVLGIDLGKNSCSVVGLDPTGRVVLRRRMRRESIVGLAAKLPGCIVAMEACCGAHHLGRLLAAQGHEVRLMSPEYVRPYVKAQKNDDRDAEANCRGGDPTDDAVRRSQDRGAARRSDFASRTRPSLSASVRHLDR